MVKMGIGMGLSSRFKVLSYVLQQKAKDNRAAHRINKVQKVREDGVELCHPILVGVASLSLEGGGV